MLHMVRGLAVAALLMAGACAPRMSPTRSTPGLPITVRVQVTGGVFAVRLEDYVRATVLSEFAPPSGDEWAVEKMFEVQAIVSRTYAVAQGSRHSGEGFDFCATTHCQLYDPSRIPTSRRAAAAADAVRRTAGVVIWSGSVPAQIVFHADCGGHTSAAGEVWSGAAPAYLRAVADEGPAAAAHAEWRFAPPASALLAALNADPRTRVGARLDRIDVLTRDDAGRARLVALLGERAPVVRGEELRTVLARALGPSALRSTRFDVTRTGAGFEFKGRGFGHGVGLCQAGAFARLAAGASPADVLAHYFPGTSLR